MQECFLGDIGDYLKYGFLRALVGYQTTGVLRLGVVWYAVRTSGTRANSRFRYLDDETFLRYDPELFQSMRRVREQGAKFEDVPQLGILPLDTVYVSDEVQSASTRGKWIEQILPRLHERQLVYLDPDNGIQFVGAPSRHHVTLQELALFLELQSSLVVYHHLNRRTSHSHQVHELNDKLRPSCTDHSIGLAWSKLGGGRVFVIAVRKNQPDKFKKLVDTIVKSAWKDQFRLIY